MASGPHLGHGMHLRAGQRPRRPQVRQFAQIVVFAHDRPVGDRADDVHRRQVLAGQVAQAPRDFRHDARRAVLVPMRPAVGEQPRGAGLPLPFLEQRVPVHHVHAVAPQVLDEVLVVAAARGPAGHVGFRRQEFRIDFRLARRDHQQERDAVPGQPVLQALGGRAHVRQFARRAPAAGVVGVHVDLLVQPARAAQQHLRAAALRQFAEQGEPDLVGRAHQRAPQADPLGQPRVEVRLHRPVPPRPRADRRPGRRRFHPRQRNVRQPARRHLGQRQDQEQAEQDRGGKQEGFHCVRTGNR